VKYEDIVADSKKTLGAVVEKMGLKTNDSLKNPSWNSEPLKQVYPWGTVKIPTPEVNIETAKELSKEEINEIKLRTELYLEHFDYTDIYNKIK
jgi:hypothetical protein